MTTINTSTNFDQLNIDQYQWPITIEGGAANSVIKIKFNSNINFTNSNNYFIVNTEYVKFEGKGYNIYIVNVPNYPGLIQNGSGSYDNQSYTFVPGFSNVIVHDINVISSGSSLADNNDGWLCRSYYSNQAINNFLIKCSVKANLDHDYTGGLCGTTTAANGGQLNIEECRYCGEIYGYGCGGLIADTVLFNGGSLFITKSIVNAIIYGNDCGGFIGPYACGADLLNPTTSHPIPALTRDLIVPVVSPLDSFITISECVFNGDINVLDVNNVDNYGSNGFVAPYAAEPSNSTINIYDSIYNGNIKKNISAGFIGYNSALFGTINLVGNNYNGSIYNVNNVVPGIAFNAQQQYGFSAGFIGYGCALFGNVNVQKCKFDGYISQFASGGIIAPYNLTNNQINVQADGNYPTGSILLLDCVNTGIIDGDYIGGIVGPDLGYLYYEFESVVYNTNYGKFVMENCVFAGEIGGLYSAGLIAGALDNINTWIFDNVTIKNCKSKCKINTNTSVALIGPGLPDNFYQFTNSNNNIVINTYDFPLITQLQ